MQIRDLVSADAMTREKAISELCGNIHHQSTTYEATPYAVRFLVEALGSDHADRPSILGLLAAIAHAPDPRPEEVAARSRAEVRAHAKGVLQHLTLHPAAAATIAFAAEAEAETFIPFLERALQNHPRPRARLALGLALARLGSYHAAAFKDGVEDLPLERLAAIARGAYDGHAEQRDLLDVVLEELTMESSSEDLVDRLNDEEGA